MKPASSSLVRHLGNAMGFQLGWWLCVLSTRHDFQGWALAVSLVLCALQWRWSSVPGQLVGLIWRVACLGLGIDSALQAVGLIQFQGWAWGGLAPFWLWAIWVMFALTLNESMAFLSRLPVWIQALTGAVAGPLSYAAGVSMGAAVWGQPWAWAIYALVWMALLPQALKWTQFQMPVASAH